MKPGAKSEGPEEETGRLARWSRRKQAARDGAPEPEAVPEAAPLAAAEPEPDPAELEANRAAAEAVDLATLGPGSDLEVFFRKGVPKLLRQQALRAVWRSDPVFANLDGLVDHGENFNDPALVMKTFTSAWKIGSGYLRETLAEAADPTGPVDTPPDAPDVPAPEIATAEADPLPIAPETTPEATPDTAPEPDPVAPVTPPKAVPPRRASLRHRLALDTDTDIDPA